MKNIIIEKIDLNDVLINDKIKYNVNNIWLNDIKPQDYDLMLNSSRTCNWYNLFHKGPFYSLPIEKWMFEALKIGAITGKFSNMYDDELNNYCVKNNIIINKDAFVRTEHASLKYGEYGTGPYNDIKKIMKSILSTTINHRCLRDDDTCINLYFMPWINNFNLDREFRVFVYKNVITAISIQHLYEKNKWLMNLDEESIKNIVSSLLTYFNNELLNKLQHINNGSYVMDIYYTLDNDWYFIECNAFGKEYSSGSSLFHWSEHYDILYDNTNILPIRFTI
ncbi:cell division cycle 123 protein [Hokovirus HKV1]|uniref:Cell division cycle 123 protein n=1 Tax=Hokovirus HKV1 TaxID=1977638 RepID=A0A1V0SEN5_9VIRU|nr:cell division cycle 123 protein [Hokovirus HKV1]